MPAKALQSLLPLLDLKIEGRNPFALFDTYLPTLDCLPLFRQERAEILNSGFIVCATAGPTGSPSTLTVPENEIWYVNALTAVESNPGATAVRVIKPIVSDRSGNLIVLCSEAHETTLNVQLALGSWNGFFVAQPGYVFGVWNHAASAGRTAEVTVHFTRVSI